MFLIYFHIYHDIKEDCITMFHIETLDFDNHIKVNNIFSYS